MANLITRTYTFTDGTTAYGSQVDSEIANIVNALNSLDQAGTTWTNVKVTTLLPQADVNFGGHKGTNLGTPSASGDAVPLTYLQSNYTTTTGMVGTRILQIVQASTSTTAGSSSSTFTATNIAASITPSANTSKIRVSIMTTYAGGGTANDFTIKRGSTNIGDSTYGFQRIVAVASTQSSVAFSYIDSPSTTSSTTYTLYVRSEDNASSWTVPLTASTGYISLEEIG